MPIPEQSQDQQQWDQQQYRLLATISKRGMEAAVSHKATGVAEGKAARVAVRDRTATGGQRGSRDSSTAFSRCGSGTSSSGTSSSISGTSSSSSGGAAVSHKYVNS